MTSTRKVRLVIEAEIQQDDELTPEVIARTFRYQQAPDLTTPDWQENIQANQALLTALVTSPAIYAEWLVRCLESELALLTPDKFNVLASIPKETSDSLHRLIPQLPPAARQFWTEAEDFGTFSDCNDLTYSATQATLTSIRLEEGP